MVWGQVTGTFRHWEPDLLHRGVVGLAGGLVLPPLVNDVLDGRVPVAEGAGQHGGGGHEVVVGVAGIAVDARFGADLVHLAALQDVVRSGSDHGPGGLGCPGRVVPGLDEGDDRADIRVYRPRPR